MEIDFDISELQALGLRMRDVISEGFRLISLELWGNIKEEAPVKSGRLAGSWEMGALDPLTWRVWTAVQYAMAVQEGTKPHDIVPRNAQTLTFQHPSIAAALGFEGSMVFLRRVRHPGTAANPYIDRAIERTEKRLDELIEIAIERVIG
jgi:hypothetical protein